MSNHPPLDASYIVHSTMTRVFDQFCMGFERWWLDQPEGVRKQWLDRASSSNSFFTAQYRESIEKGTRDLQPVTHLLDTLKVSISIRTDDPQTIRIYRNRHTHREKADPQFMRIDAIEGCLDAIARILETLGAEPERLAAGQLGAWVCEFLLSPDTAGPLPGSETPAATQVVAFAAEREPRPEPPQPPRVQDPPFRMPARRSSTEGVREPAPVVELERLSADQRSAVQRAVEWFRDPTRSGAGHAFAITGPAGSGKTTVVSAIIEQLRLQPNQVQMIAPTGKAVEALKVRLPHGWKGRARTLASFLWQYQMVGHKGEDAEFVIKGAKTLDRAVRLVVVDEASMVTHRDAEALRLYPRVLYIGDADQLPPVVEPGEDEAQAGTAGVLDAPDARLEMVHRQGAGSSVLRIAEQARAGLDIPYGPSDDERVVHLSEAEGHFGVDQMDDIIERVDVLLTQRNSLRVRINEYVRWKRGFMRHPLDFDPKPGEVLVSSENYQHPVSRTKVANGERLIVEALVGRRQLREDRPDVEEYIVQAHPEGRKQDSQQWTISSQMLAGDQIRGAVVSTEHVSGPRSKVLRCDWGYALTVHKAQGSEWPLVAVIDDLNPDHMVPRQQWNYVAYSRASEQLFILKVRRDTLLFTVFWARV